MNRKRNPWLANGLAILLGGGIATTAMSVPPPIVGTSSESQHNFLLSPNFFPNNPETVATAKAYLDTINPGGVKNTIVPWLMNAGFIKNASDWKPTGQQIYTTVPGDYGPGKINAFAHFIYLNAADLGFIRNQYIRCIPDCKTPNAKIYTYLENYPAPARLPNESDAAFLLRTQQAVNLALEQRVGRIADVNFEWAPPANNPTSTARFGQIYAMVVHPIGSLGGTCNNNVFTPTGTITLDESLLWSNDQAAWDCIFNTRPITTVGPDFLKPRPETTVIAGDPFAPELDALGTKQSPGVCLICHGGDVPQNIATTLNWGNGQIGGFKFLPVDNNNAVFGVDDTPAALSPGAFGSNLTVSGQQTEIKKYNQAVLQTQGARPPQNATFAPDGTITGGNWRVGSRPTHAQELILGWYAGAPGDLSMSASVQNGNFVPVGWRTSAEAQNLYLKVVAPTCRSCHLNRDASVDFNSVAEFDSQKSNIEEYTLLPECDSIRGQVNPNKQVMPLARLTWVRFWQGINPATNLVNNDPNAISATDPNSQPNLLKAHFGFAAGSTGPGTYCGHIN